ncbi:MAG: ATP-dependent helicase HrpB [Pirellula sp.]
MKPLPIDPHLGAIATAVQRAPIVFLEAPPGTGKTTRVAPHLMDAIVPADKRLFLLQPRRLAARSVAARIADERGESLGHSVGYSVRMDHRVGRDTRLIVATEGILIRRLQDDPAIEDTSVVLLDEFHERSLDADLIFAMLRRVQQTLREDLRILIMSATLEESLVREHFPEAPWIRVDAMAYPVDIRYRPLSGALSGGAAASMAGRMVEHAAEVVSEQATQRPGDVLVFLPGAGEIHRCNDVLMRRRVDASHDLVPLYGSMPLEQQMAAIESGVRPRVVLATNIAETSLTIPGVQTVIDSGLARVLRYSPDVGLDRLVMENISAASARQRAGRAGRVAPGVCIRLWSEASDRARAAFLEPEICRVDLAGAVLQLFAWGEGNSSDFPWLERPREDAFASAKRLLEGLGAVAAERVTPLGQELARLPLHPRLARMVYEAAMLGCLEDAGWIAAMLSERDPFDRRESHGGQRGQVPTSSARRWDSDCVERLHALRDRGSRDEGRTPFGTVHMAAKRAIEQSAKQILQIGESIERRATRSHGRDGSQERALPTDVGVRRAILAGFPDRVAKRRALGRQQALMVGGKGVQLAPQSGVTESELFVCVEIEAGPGDALVRQASGIDAAWLTGGSRRDCEELFFHPSQKQVVARRRSYWMDLVLSETPCAIQDEGACEQVLYDAVRSHWHLAFPSEEPEVVQWLSRVACLRGWMPELELPEFHQEMLMEVARDLCRGKRSLEEVRRGAWIDWLQGRLNPQQLQAVQREAPEKLQVPSGSWIRIEYALGKPPVLAVKIQEVFSWQQTPKIAAGRVPLLLHLLAPNMRPQQITEDLASFWRSGYTEVRKELKRRYPKHSWPDDPTTASPTRR